jgi:hypothetical protein
VKDIWIKAVAGCAPAKCFDLTMLFARRTLYVSQQQIAIATFLFFELY